MVNQTTFITGRPSPVDRNVVVNVREDFAKHQNIVVGRPPIKPVESSYVPVDRAIPEAKRPPPAVRKVDAKELRQSRPMVTEQDRSAFRPQAKPAPLAVKKIEKPRPASERATERQQAVPKERARPGGIAKESAGSGWNSAPSRRRREPKAKAAPKGRSRSRPAERPQRAAGEGKAEAAADGRPQAPSERVKAGAATEGDRR